MINLPEYMLPTEKFNLPLARKVLEYAEQEHDDFKFDMDDWYEEVRTFDYKKAKQICKTSACLAGTVGLLAAKVNSAGIYIADEWYDHEDGAIILLGIDKAVAETLFYAGNDQALSLLRQMVEYAETHDPAV